MSERQEDEPCPSRGLGHRAAIGVGVGAALYDFFSDRQEHPDAEGSTSEGWQCQQLQTLNASEDEHITISKHRTSEEFVLDDSYTIDLCNESSIITINDSGESVPPLNLSEYNSDNDADMTPDLFVVRSLSDSKESIEIKENTNDENDSSSSYKESSSSTNSVEFIPLRNSSVQSHYTINSSPTSDVHNDVTNSSIGIPVKDNMSRSISPLSSLFPTCIPMISSQKKKNASEDEHITISEHRTSEDFVLDDSYTIDLCNESSIITINDSEESVPPLNLSEYNSDNDADMTPDLFVVSSLSDSKESMEIRENTNDENDSSSSYKESSSSTNSVEFIPLRNSSVQSHYTINSSPTSDVHNDVTNSSIGIPVKDNMSRSISPLSSLFPTCIPMISSQKKNREPSWTLEECAICFEIMLNDQELMALPCTHNFHVACIGPWLQEQQTCPICRKVAE